MHHLMELKNATPLGFYAPRRNFQESPKWFGMRLATEHKMKTETQIEEASSLLDSWHRILAISPLTPGSHPSLLVHSRFIIGF
jgi:hypothetical protein